MDSRLILTLLIVTLTGGFMGTYAENTTTTTTMPANNMTTTTMPANNMTTTTMPANNMTTTTMPANNMTTTSMPANNMTTAVPTTTPAPIVTNETVTNLTIPVARSDCGKSQLCAAQPSDCDPSNGTCFFLSAKVLGGQNFQFALSGESDGYIAATLSPDATLGGNDTTYICANDKGVVRYFSALLNNGKLIRTPLRVNNVRGRVNGKNIQCQFDATVPDATSTTTRAATSSTSFSISVSTGSYNATSDDLGSPTAQITTNVVDLRNANATTTDVNNSTTTMAPSSTSTTTTAPSSTTNTTTMAPSNTTAAPTTAAPLVPDSNVTTLNTSITRENCSKTELCVAEPSDCDPSNGTCFFLGAQLLSGQNFRFSLSGDSDGYIAATLSPDTILGGNDTTYICANSNGVVRYFGALLNNGTLTRTELRVNNVRGRVKGKNIQCQFDATVPNATSTSTRAATDSTSFSISISTGSYNASSDSLGSPTARITTNVVDLRNATATITNLLNSNTTTTAPSPTTTTPAGNAVTIQQSVMQALLITVGVLSLTWL